MNYEHKHEHTHCHEAGGCCCHMLTAENMQFIKQFRCTDKLPVSIFVLKCSKSEHVECIALQPIFLYSREDSMEKVKVTASMLKNLEEHGIIQVDYENRVDGYDYGVYESSDAYKYFEDAVREGRDKAGFLFDTAEQRYGSIALTPDGQNIVERSGI